MSEFVLGGHYTAALTHFAGYGLTTILGDAGHRDLRLHWTDEPTPRFILSGPTVAEELVAEAIRTHAAVHASEQSWVQQKVTYPKGKKQVTVGLFSPRIAVPDSVDSWTKIYAERQRFLDLEVNSGPLDSVMLQALGEPASWQFGDSDAQFDEGASRWEMKTRNRGEDFTQNRLSGLARIVSDRSSEEIAGALSGTLLNDSSGKQDSRTGTGLVPPSPVDDTLAWCGLWGISAFKLFQKVSGVAVTPGAWPTDRVHPEWMALPVFTDPVSIEKVRRIIRSKAFSDAAFGAGTNAGTDAIIQVAACERLHSLGVAGLMKFPINKAGSSSAPERQVLAGSYVPV